jgi:hypothetical protein
MNVMILNLSLSLLFSRSDADVRTSGRGHYVILLVKPHTKQTHAVNPAGPNTKENPH